MGKPALVAAALVAAHIIGVQVVLFDIQKATIELRETIAANHEFLSRNGESLAAATVRLERIERSVILLAEATHGR